MAKITMFMDVYPGQEYFYANNKPTGIPTNHRLKFTVNIPDHYLGLQADPIPVSEVIEEQ